jgi:predicted RNase H-like HicB family nuclease
MIYRLGVENIEPNHWVAFVFGHPGCFSSAQTQAEAIANAPARIADYFEWLAGFVGEKRGKNLKIEVELSEVFRAYPSPDDSDSRQRVI